MSEKRAFPVCRFEVQVRTQKAKEGVGVQAGLYMLNVVLPLRKIAYASRETITTFMNQLMDVTGPLIVSAYNYKQVEKPQSVSLLVEILEDEISYKLQEPENMPSDPPLSYMVIQAYGIANMFLSALYAHAHGKIPPEDRKIIEVVDSVLKDFQVIKGKKHGSNNT